MKKLFLLASFFLGTPLLLGICILMLAVLSYSHSSDRPSILALHQFRPVSYAAIPAMQNVLGDQTMSQDARVEIVRQFLQQYNSPLEPHARDIVLAAEAYGLDYRLLPAIAMQESNLCRKAPKDSNNCWGFGIYGGKVRTFETYPEAIEIISKTLAKEYKHKGLVTPDEIMTKYTPSNTGAWADSVNHFMDQLQ